MKYLFILGKNKKLSAAEIFSYFEKQGRSIKNSELKSNSMLVETDREINENKTINELGGTIAIGKALFSGSIEEILNSINKNEIYFEEKIKFTYSLLDFSDSDSGNMILKTIKQKFNLEKLKARYRKVERKMKMQRKLINSGNPSKINTTDSTYFLFKNKDYVFGIIKGKYDPKQIEKRDMKKPVRRQKLAISPRSAKILINLSQVKENETLFDAFCGIGIILQEALLQNINVIGNDINKDAVLNAQKNISWIEKNYNFNSKFILLNQDSRTINLDKIENHRVDGIATEPDLGELLKKSSNKTKSK